MIETRQLLVEFVRQGSEKAFREIVARHVNLVFSTALRSVRGDTLLAEDVAQLVFIDLARQAARLPEDVHLAGWLHRHTCFTASKALRGELRRINRERQAMEMKAINDQPDALLAEIGPGLDEAINELGTADRLAIMLRFFEQHDFRAVGLGLGVSEDAARMRVNRAVDKLRTALSARGVACQAVMLGNALTLHAVVPAPAGMAAVLSANALAAAAGAGAGGGVGVLLARWLSAAKVKVAVVSALGGLAVVVVVKSVSNSTGDNAASPPSTMATASSSARSTPTAYERIQAQLRESARQPAAPPLQLASAITAAPGGERAAALPLYSALAGRTILHGQLRLPAELSAKMTADPSKAVAVFEKELEAAGYAVLPDGEKFVQIMPLADTNKPRAKPPPCNPEFKAKIVAATNQVDFPGIDLGTYLDVYALFLKRTILRPAQLVAPPIELTTAKPLTQDELAYAMGVVLHLNGIEVVAAGDKFAEAMPIAATNLIKTNAPRANREAKMYQPAELELKEFDSVSRLLECYVRVLGDGTSVANPTPDPLVYFKVETALAQNEVLYAIVRTLNLNGLNLGLDSRRLLRVEEIPGFTNALRPGLRGFGARGTPRPQPTPTSSTPAR